MQLEDEWYLVAPNAPKQNPNVENILGVGAKRLASEHLNYSSRVRNDRT